MAEVQKTTDAGETTHLFIQFIMMQQQQALLALGKYPNPPAGAPPANLVVSKLLIDQLVAIREKTRGNLTADEQSLLSNVISGLQMGYTEAVAKK